MKKPRVYILAGQRNGTLYTGVTSGPANRPERHGSGNVDGFTRRYRVYPPVWYEEHDSIVNAIAGEKAIKKWNRAWKPRLVEEANPQWRDLAGDIPC